MYVRCFFPPKLYVTLHHFSNDRPNLSLAFPSTIFQTFQDIIYLHSAVPKFQKHTKLCSKCSISLVSCFNPICRQKVFFLWNNRSIYGFSSFPFVHGALNFLWKSVTPIIVGWFRATCRHTTVICTHNRLNYCVIFIIYA